MDSRELSGNWWLPNEPDIQITGALTFSNKKGILLRLNGIFQRELVNNPRGVRILGETYSGNPVTIHQCILVDAVRTVGNKLAGNSTFVANKAYVGKHIEDPNDDRIEALSYVPSNFDYWLNYQDFEVATTDDGFVATFARREGQTLNINDGLSINIGWREEQVFGSPHAELNFKRNFTIVINPNEESPIAPFFTDLLWNINNFLSLAMMERVYPTKIHAHIGGDKFEILIPLYTEILERRIDQMDMLFSYGVVGDRFEQFLSNWINNADVILPVYDLYFSNFFDLSSSWIQKFLNYSQALETYHQRRLPNQRIEPRTEHRARVREIIEASPKHHRAWLKDSLSGSNRRTFKMRLQDLIDINPRIVVARHGDIDLFLRTVVRSRNFYTHYNPDNEGDEARGGELAAFAVTLGTMVEYFLLIEIGFTHEEADRIIRERRSLPSAYTGMAYK